MKKLISVFLFFLMIGGVSVNYFFFNQAKASNLKEGYIFLGNMGANKETEIVLLLTPSTDFNSPVEERILKISFPGEKGDWCQVDNAELEVVGIESSPIDLDDWLIEAPFPGTLSARCLQNTSGDFIEIKGIDYLSANVKYGLQINKSSDFSLTSSGTYSVPIVLLEGINQQLKNMMISVSDSSSISVVANILDISTITCTLSHSSLSFGTLPKDGNYVTVQHTARTSARDLDGYYWAVFGQGDGTEAGLWKSTPPESLIPSSGDKTINLSLERGFGLVVSSPQGNVRPDFANTTPGEFGTINSGQNKARLMFTYLNPVQNPLVQTITLGARAGVTSEPGVYSERLTYICGGFY